MKREEVYDAWAPEAAAWTSWVKPVLFDCLGDYVDPGSAWIARWLLADYLTPLGSVAEVAIVVDLPGAEGVNLGLAVAKLGFRPIPLYNAVHHPQACVDMTEVMLALVDSAEHLCGISAQARPAFLLDSRRQQRPSVDRRYDNRSVVRTSDVPSGRWLLGENIRRLLLVQATPSQLPHDLSLVLESWQAAGIELFSIAQSEPAPAAQFVARRTWLARLHDVVDIGPQQRNDGAYGRFWLHGG